MQLNRKFYPVIQQIGITPPVGDYFFRNSPLLSVGLPCKVTDHNGSIYDPALIIFEDRVHYPKGSILKKAADIAELEQSENALTFEARVMTSYTSEDDHNPVSCYLYSPDGDRYQCFQENFWGGEKRLSQLLSPVRPEKELHDKRFKPPANVTYFLADWHDDLFEYIGLRNDFRLDLLENIFSFMKKQPDNARHFPTVIAAEDPSVLDGQIASLNLNKVAMAYGSRFETTYSIYGFFGANADKYYAFNPLTDIGIITLDGDEHHDEQALNNIFGFGQGVRVVTGTTKKQRVMTHVAHHFYNLHNDLRRQPVKS